jgi:hypothetical protein
MAFNPAPTEVIASWAEDGTTVSFDLADVTELDAAEADAMTGDSRRILFALMEQYYNWWVGMVDADKPTKMSFSKNSSLQNDGTYRNTYSLAFTTEVTGQEVANEPT